MSDRLRVLFVASECVPFAKAGGLGDVVGALPRALEREGHDVRVVIPRYDTIKTAGMQKHPAPLGVPTGVGEMWCAVWETRLPDSDVPVYMLDHAQLFGRGYIYDPPGRAASDNLLRFSFLSRGALQVCRGLQWIPDVLHVHDWPTALVPVYTNTTDARDFARTASVLTLHNVAHQGMFPAEHLRFTGLGAGVFHERGLEDRGAINTLKGGLYHATKLTTVSPRYSAEVRAPAGGMGLEGVLNFRGADLIGILNGIDEDIWDPASDRHTPVHFDATDLAGKAQCKSALQRELGLTESPETPLVAIISRMTKQKGTDVIAAALDRLLGLGIQIGMLGSGDPEHEAFFGMRSHRSGSQFRAWIGFNEPLSHRLEAGADLFLMPSRFEPCGLNQMYSQRYGTLPIVRNTGGLHDTVEPFNPATGAGTGFRFDDLTPNALVSTVAWAVDTYRNHPWAFRKMQVRAMQRPFGWHVAALQYLEVYRWALAARRG